MTQLDFTREYFYPDETDGITIPTYLSYGDQNIVVNAKFDTGAAYCLFRNEHAIDLGVPVEDGIYVVLDTLGGPLEAFGHEVVIQTCDIAFQSVVYFAKYPNLRRNLLGRQGWLRKLRMAIIDYDNLLYLSAYDS
jgi:hypothetical protein